MRQHTGKSKAAQISKSEPGIENGHDSDFISLRLPERPNGKLSDSFSFDRDPVRAYLNEIAQYPILSKKEQLQLAKKITETRKKYITTLLSVSNSMPNEVLNILKGVAKEGVTRNKYIDITYEKNLKKRATLVKSLETNLDTAYGVHVRGMRRQAEALESSSKRSGWKTFSAYRKILRDRKIVAQLLFENEKPFKLRHVIKLGLDCLARDKAILTSAGREASHYKARLEHELGLTHEVMQKGWPKVLSAKLAYENARKELMETNLRLVVPIAKEYSRYEIPLLDLIQEGNAGLHHATEKFDYSKGHAFTTYAVYWIRQAITRHVADKKRMVKLPASLTVEYKKVNDATIELRQALEREPTHEEISKKCRVSLERVQALAVEENHHSINIRIRGQRGGNLCFRGLYRGAPRGRYFSF